jgi:hypothetical protein
VDALIIAERGGESKDYLGEFPPAFGASLPLGYEQPKAEVTGMPETKRALHGRGKRDAKRSAWPANCSSPHCSKNAETTMPPGAESDRALNRLLPA